MSSKVDVSTPKPFEVNGIWKFFSLMSQQEGEADPPPLGPFVVREDFKIERKERDISVQRILILKPEKGCTLPTYEEYAVEYPDKLLHGNLMSFESKGGACRIRVRFTPGAGLLNITTLMLKNQILPVFQYVLYEEQVEGTWIPIEADGKALRP